MKISIFKIISFSLVIIWMSTVFYFSDQPSSSSTNQSRGFIRVIFDKFPTFNNLNEDEKAEIIKNVQPFVRKVAHLLLYATGGVLIALLFFCLIIK